MTNVDTVEVARGPYRGSRFNHCVRIGVSQTTSDICKIIVVTPTRTTELALPTYLPLADLLPTLVGMVDERLLADASGKGVVLQRLGDEPLDQSHTPAALGLKDGDLIHLRAVDSAMPALRFDDLVDGVAVRMGMLSGRWTSRCVRPLFLGLTVLSWVIGLILLWLSVDPLHGAAAAASVTIVLLGSAVAAARGWGDSTAGLLLAAGAICYGAMAGVMVAPLLHSSGVRSLRHLDMLSVVLGGAALALVAVLATALLARAGEFLAPERLLIPTVLGLLVCAIGSLASFASMSIAQAGALVAASGLFFAPMIPTIAFRLAGMRLPNLPQSSADAVRPAEPIVDTTLARSAELADRYVTTLYGCLSLLALSAIVMLAMSRDGLRLSLAAVLAMILILRSKALSGAWQRLSLLTSGALGLSAWVIAVVRLSPATARPGLAVVMAVVVGLSLLASARLLPGRPLRPYWGRAAELLETLLAISVLPLTLAVIGLLGLVRQIGG
jgi:type VII secretion integral membrane protein EccD